MKEIIFLKRSKIPYNKYILLPLEQ